MPVANRHRYWKDIVVNMENNTQKLDAALEFALQVPGPGGNGSSQAGYNAEEDRWRVIVKYYGDINSIIAGITGAEATSLFNNYAVVNVPASQLDALSEAQGIVYIEKPREMYYNVNNGREASCISAVQADVTGRPVQGSLGLDGKGVLVGIIDSGIDYLHPGFRNDNGTTRILYLWDQSAGGEESYGRIPAGYTQGAEYSKEDIDEALAQPDRAASLKIVPVTDRGSGHGTAVAGVAAGNGAASPGRRYRKVVL